MKPLWWVNQNSVFSLLFKFKWKRVRQCKNVLISYTSRQSSSKRSISKTCSRKIKSALLTKAKFNHMSIQSDHFKMLLEIMGSSDSHSRKMAFLTLTLLVRRPSLGLRFAKLYGLAPISSLVLFNQNPDDELSFKGFIFKYQNFQKQWKRDCELNSEAETPVFWRFDEKEDEFEIVGMTSLNDLLKNGSWKNIPDPRFVFCGGFFSKESEEFHFQNKVILNSFAIRKPQNQISFSRNSNKDENSTVKNSNSSLVPGSMYSKLSMLIRRAINVSNVCQK